MNRFWSKVDRRGGHECWNWTAGTFAQGYGQFWWNGGPQKAHRMAFELTNGSIPEGTFILHSCDNRLCCNPAHLRAGTHMDNMTDMTRRRTKQCPHTNRWAILNHS